MKKKTLCCAAALALSSGATLAETNTIELAETSIVGTSVIDQNNVDSFGSLTTVVGQEQIRDLNALDLSSALRRTPGVVVSRFNPVGSFGGAEGGAVYIRGMGASRPGSEIKTYIDGVPFYMGVWGHPLLDLLPINAMQSITVYKGPQPQKFGNTFAAIDLTPKVAEQGDNHHGELQLTGGSFRTATEQASLIGREGNFDYLLAQGAAHSDGDRSDGDGRLNNGMARLGYRLVSVGPGHETAEQFQAFRRIELEQARAHIEQGVPIGQQPRIEVDETASVARVIGERQAGVAPARRASLGVEQVRHSQRARHHVLRTSDSLQQAPA